MGYFYVILEGEKVKNTKVIIEVCLSWTTLMSMRKNVSFTNMEKIKR
jgi:hypothetical protein